MNKAVKQALLNLRKAEQNLETALKASYEQGSEVKFKSSKGKKITVHVLRIEKEKLYVRNHYTGNEYWINVNRLV